MEPKVRKPGVNIIEASISEKADTAELVEVSLTRFVGYFLRLGTFGFGGPIALAGHMQQDLAEERHWISKQDYVEGLALAQLAPGPLAAQLAIYLGYVRNGILGATAVAIAFVLPSFLMVLALSAAYVRFGGLRWMQAIFYGIGASVIAIIARSAYKLTKLTLGKDKLLWGDLCRSSSHYSMDFTRDSVAFPGGWRSGASGQSDAHKSTGRDHKAGGLAVRSANPGRGQRPTRNFSLFRQGWNVCVRQWTGRGAIPLRRSSARTSLAHRPAIRRCRRRRDDHARPSRHHGCLHWLPCCRHFRGNGCGAGHFLPRLFNCGVACSILQTVGQKSPAECIRPRCDRCGDRGHRRGGDRTGATLHLLCSDVDDCGDHPWGPHPLEGAGADFDSLRSSCGCPVTVHVTCYRPRGKGETVSAAIPTS